MALSKKKKKSASGDASDMILDNVSFQASEAYKLLRTNLEFMAYDGKCRKIGVTSGTRGEGKSTLSINLAYAISQSNKKVLLIDGDLRLPSISEKMNIKQEFGLSNILTENSDSRTKLTVLSFNENLFVLPSGPIPPNPSELLGSKRCEYLLRDLGNLFDYIIVDLPPINIVSDASVISNKLDGLIMVVRENYARLSDTKEAMRKLSLVKARILGMVLTDDDQSGKHYGSYYRKKAMNNYYKSGNYAQSSAKKQSSLTIEGKETDIKI